MKTRWLIAWVVAAAAWAAEPEIELTGVLGSGRDTRVALKTKDNAPRWVGIGQQFAGYTVSSYEAKDDTVVLTKEGRQLKLSLRKSKVTHGTTEPPPEIKKGILNNLRQLAAAADQFYLENGKSTVTYDQLVGMDKYVKRVNPVAGEDYRAIQFVQGKTMRVTTSSGHEMTYAP